ncbi:MAG: FAD binding domain-containing protein [Candidatus Bipolaricaulota bacterium]
MTLPRFELLQPASVGEAVELLASRPEAISLAGGTALLVDLRSRRTAPPALIDLGRIGDLRGVTQGANEISIGAMTTIAELLNHPMIKERAPLLAQACATFGSPLVRNRATIGGNVVHASPAAELAPALLALDASIEFKSVRGRRLVRAVDVWKGPGKTTRKADELVTSIRIPHAAGRWGHAWRKLGLRKADAIAVASVAVRLSLRDDGTCDEARIALGAVAPTPLRVAKAEAALAGKAFADERVLEAAKAAADACSPIDDVRASAAYRRRVVGVLVRRALAEAGLGGR